MGEPALTITALEGIPQVRPGDDLPVLLIAAIERGGLAPRRHYIVVVTQKIVSKAEGRYLDLATITPSRRAEELAAVTRKDARLVEAILSQSAEVLRDASDGEVAHSLATQTSVTNTLMQTEDDKDRLGPALPCPLREPCRRLRQVRRVRTRRDEELSMMRAQAPWTIVPVKAPADEQRLPGILPHETRSRLMLREILATLRQVERLGPVLMVTPT